MQLFGAGFQPSTRNLQMKHSAASSVTHRVPKKGAAHPPPTSPLSLHLQCFPRHDFSLRSWAFPNSGTPSNVDLYGLLQYVRSLAVAPKDQATSLIGVDTIQIREMRPHFDSSEAS